MAAPVNAKEKARRLRAFEKSKKLVKGGSITEASRILGNVSKSALSRFLLNLNLQTDHSPSFTKEQCFEALRTYISRHKKIPSRDDFSRNSAIGVRWKTHWDRWSGFLEDAKVVNDSTKILLLDIETSPNRAYFWGGTWKVNIDPDWIDADGHVLCWSAKWLDSEDMIFQRLKNKNHKMLLAPIHELLNQAHAVIHYNGTKFDIPTLNKSFLTHGFTPPSPYKQIDLLLTMREGFRFPSNKLDYICQSLDLGGKLRHQGAQLWMDCMEDDAEAWKTMEAYNRRDVELLEKLYRKLMPWIRRHPNRAAFSGMQVCVYCGSFDIQRDRTYTAQQLTYERYKCGDCGGWFRGTRSINPRNEKRFALTN